jgi:hypothetical protein
LFFKEIEIFTEKPSFHRHALWAEALRVTLSSTQRSKLWRQREAAGRIVLHVEVDETKIAATMIEAGFLDPLRADDRCALRAAVERYLENAEPVEVRATRPDDPFRFRAE